MVQPETTALDPRDVLRVDAESEEPIIDKRLLRFCVKRTRDRDRARDASSEAISRVLAAEGWHRWNYNGKHPPAVSLLMHLCDLAKDFIKVDGNRAANWREVAPDSSRDVAVPDSQPTVGEMPAKWEKHNDELRDAAVVMDRLDERARQMLLVESESDEELDAEELAGRLGWEVKEVYRARERVLYHRDIVLAQKSRKEKGGLT